MARKKKEIAAPETKALEVKITEGKAIDPLAELQAEISEVRGDLRRVIELIIHGNLDSAKFREILNNKQGA